MTYIQHEPASGEFDYTTIPTDIADLMRAAADRVRELQRAAMRDIGLALLAVKDHSGDGQFAAWVERECRIPKRVAQHAIDTAELSVAAGLLASAAPAAKSVSVDVVERGELRRQRKPEQPKQQIAPSPWVVKREQTDHKKKSGSVAALVGSSRQHSPEHMVASHRRPARFKLKYAEMRHRCLAAMRDGSVITAQTVVTQMMRDRSLDPDRNQRLWSDLLKRALRALDALVRCGRVEKIGSGHGVRWVLVVS